MHAARHPRRLLPRVLWVALFALLTLASRSAPGTVAEQRARLPPAAECAGKVEGKWKAQVYTAGEGAWYEFDLEIHKVPGSETELTGLVHVHSWRGDPNQASPGPCDGRLHYRGTMNGRGSYHDGDIAFGGSDFHLDETMCGEMGGYNPDQFTGRIDERLQEFQSVNNDGGQAVNEPTVFRRIGCFDEGPKANADVTPPPYYPERRQGGCSCSVGE